MNHTENKGRSNQLVLRNGTNDTQNAASCLSQNESECSVKQPRAAMKYGHSHKKEPAESLCVHHLLLLNNESCGSSAHEVICLLKHASNMKRQVILDEKREENLLALSLSHETCHGPWSLCSYALMLLYSLSKYSKYTRYNHTTIQPYTSNMVKEGKKKKFLSLSLSPSLILHRDA